MRFRNSQWRKNCLSPSFLYPPFFNQLPSPNGSWFFSRVMSQNPSLLETLANTAKPGESSKGSWHRKINYYKVLRKQKKFLCKRMWERSLTEKSVHNSWIYFIKSDKKKRKQIKKVTKTLDFMRVWGMLTNLRKKIKWNHRKARAKKANR